MLSCIRVHTTDLKKGKPRLGLYFSFPAITSILEIISAAAYLDDKLLDTFS